MCLESRKYYIISLTDLLRYNLPYSHKIHLLKAYGSMAFSIFTELYDYYNQFYTISIRFQKKPLYPLAVSYPPVTHPPTNTVVLAYNSPALGTHH